MSEEERLLTVLLLPLPRGKGHFLPFKATFEYLLDSMAASAFSEYIECKRP